MLKILIAPNSFKNSLTADQVASAIEAGLSGSAVKAELVKFPIADGGDHTSYLLSKHLNGTMNSAKVHGAYLELSNANYGLINNAKTAVIEVAETSGFKSINNKLQSPLISSTKGLGELIKYNIESGITDFIICLGGSVTVDAGIGMLQELGLRFINKSGDKINPLPGEFHEVHSIDLDDFNNKTALCSFTVLCDVNNKLLGEDGAAKVFGPQKGANISDIEKLEEFLNHFEVLTKRYTGKSLDTVIGGGAAGGLGAALSVYLNAEMKPGASYFCEISNFETVLQKSNILITGEGSIDSQSLEGKAPVVVAALAKKYNIPCFAIAGQIPVEISPELQEYFSMLLPIGNKPETLEKAIENTEKNIFRTAQQIGNLLKSNLRG